MLLQKYGGKDDKHRHDGKGDPPRYRGKELAVPRRAGHRHGADHVDRGTHVGVGVKFVKMPHDIGKQIVPGENLGAKLLLGGPDQIDQYRDRIGGNDEPREKAEGADIKQNAVGAGQYFIDGSEMDKVAAILDYVQLMTYDMRSGFTKQAGHHAALGLSAGDTTNTSTRGIVEMYHDAGVPYEKMIVGAAFYCRHFTGVRNENNGLLQPSESVGEYGPNFDGITDEFKAENNFAEYWDDDAEASYLWNGSTLVSFESPEAIRRKCRYVKEKGLLGIMYWEHGSDTTKELLSTMFETINE